jgi:hypothetical protein
MNIGEEFYSTSRRIPLFSEEWEKKRTLKKGTLHNFTGNKLSLLGKIEYSLEE